MRRLITAPLAFRFLLAVTAAVLLLLGCFAGPDFSGNLAGLGQIGFALLNGSAGSLSFPVLSGSRYFRCLPPFTAPSRGLCGVPLVPSREPRRRFRGSPADPGVSTCAR